MVTYEEKFVKEKELKQKIIFLLEQAKQEFVYFTILKKNTEVTLPLLLRQSADKRKRYTYYSRERSLPTQDQQLHEAKLFLDNTVKPYIFIMEKLKC